MGVPDNKESYYSPQLYTLPDGVQIVLFGTGGETHGGSLWRITLKDLINGDIKKVVVLIKHDTQIACRQKCAPYYVFYKVS